MVLPFARNARHVDSRRRINDVPSSEGRASNLPKWDAITHIENAPASTSYVIATLHPPVRHQTCKIIKGPAFWRARREEFDRLLQRQRSALTHDTDGRWLRGYCRFDLQAGRRSSRAGGYDGRFISDFDEIATHAATGLRCVSECEPVEFWIYCLGLDLKASPDKEVRHQMLLNESLGIVHGLVEASAAYCSRLAGRALSTPQSATGQVSRGIYVDKRHKRFVSLFEEIIGLRRGPGQPKTSVQEDWLEENHGLSRTQLTDYLGGRIAGRVSAKKRNAIEKAISASAQRLGLLHPDR